MHNTKPRIKYSINNFENVSYLLKPSEVCKLIHMYVASNRNCVADKALQYTNVPMARICVH